MINIERVTYMNSSPDSSTPVVALSISARIRCTLSEVSC